MALYPLLVKRGAPGFKIGMLVCRYADILIYLYAKILTGSRANTDTFWKDGYGTVKTTGIGQEGSAFAYPQ